MRNLTIHRQKRFVASAGKMKVYIVDTEQCELTIDGEPCRKLGTLKNGEEKTFSIGNEEAKIYVIGDKMSRNYSYGCVTVPEGEEDVCLTGKNTLNPGMGNPFVFDGEGAVGKRPRKRGFIGWIVLIVALVLGNLAGHFGAEFILHREPAAKDFTVQNMTITLNKGFEESAYEGLTTCYESRDAVVLVLREGFDLAPGFGLVTAEEYCGYALDASGIAGSEIWTKGNTAGFEYSNTGADGRSIYRYYAVVHKTDDAFWMVQFATAEDEYQKMLPRFEKWAQSIRFDSGSKI